ncbi:hypothetical protein K7X08_002253 [Anisodus acutangulus]|uniref:Uncharacterized protein n=1 Tax=Anisodus acutangulus TaxID=402998 RepID=A0A9Q1LSK9_9SOLA|nr:hypothetical protein K7X08_002253 [Anisodus acutangulus]
MAARLFRPHGHGALGQLFFITNSKFLFQYSTKTSHDPTHLLVNYLVNSLGFSRTEAISTNTKVTRSKSTGNPQIVLKFFEQSGLDKTHIGKVVSLVPKVLLCDVDKTLKPKLDILQDLGLSGNDLVKVITGSVSILGSHEVSKMKVCVTYLRKVLGSDEYVVKAIKKKPCLLFVKSCERLRINMLFFQSIGFSDENIKKFIIQHPYTLLASPESVEEKVERLQNEFNISRGSGMFIHGVDVFISMKVLTIDTKLGIFRDYGWPKWDIIKLVQLLPYCLRLSQERLRAALNFYMVERGFKPAYLASHPTLLMFSMKKRVLPRLELMRSLVEKKLYDEDYNLLNSMEKPKSNMLFGRVFWLNYNFWMRHGRMARWQWPGSKWRVALQTALQDESMLGTASYMLGMNPYIAAQADAGNTPNNTKKLAISWMLPYLLVVSFDGLFSIVVLRKMMIMKYKLTYLSGTATAYLINCFHSPKGAKLTKKQVGSLFTSFGAVQWIFASEDGCGFGSLRLFGSQAYAKRTCTICSHVSWDRPTWRGRFWTSPQALSRLSVWFFLAAILINLLTQLLKKFETKYGIYRFVSSPMCMAIPFYLGGYFAIDMCLGSLILFIWQMANKQKAKDFEPAWASGLICGESLWGIPASVLALAGVNAPFCMKF